MKEGWKNVKLGDIIHIKHGYGFKGEYFVDEPTKNFLLTPGNFAIGGGYKSDKIKYYDGPIDLEFILKPGDVIVTMTDLSKQADTLGYSAKVPNDLENTYLHNQRIGLISLKDKNVDLDFVHWLLRTNFYQRYIAGSSSGATVKHTSPKKIYSANLLIPEDKSVQQKIASILSGYDDLIENNLKRIKLLEEKAQLIYEEWFVRMKFPGHELVAIDNETDLPEGWTEFPLGKLVTLVKETVQPQNIPSDTPYIGLEHIPRKSISLSDWEFSDKIQSTKYRFEKFDILFGKIRPYFHKVGFALTDGISSTDAIILRPKQFSHHGLILQTVFTERFVDTATQSSNGTKMPRANWKVLKNYPVIIPAVPILEKYQNLSSKILNLIETLVKQNQLLKEARDILLPRLMTGMIDVEKLDLEEFKEQSLGMVAEEKVEYNKQ